MIKLFQLREMAAEPRTRQKAERLARVLPSTKKEAQQATAAFWKAFLTTKFGWKEEGDPPRVMDEMLSVKNVTIAGGDKVPFLEWYAVVTFMPRKSMMMTMIITTLDEPGAYRMDLIVPGVRKTLGRAIREEATKEVMSMQDRITTTLSDEDLETFSRLRTSMAKVKHTHKDGVRQDDNLIARVSFDEIPLQDLHERAGEIKKIVRTVGEIAAKAVVEDERDRGKTKKGDS